MKDSLTKYRVVLLLALLGAGILAAAFWDPIWRHLTAGCDFITDRTRVETFITGFGAGAPLIFIGIQILQVIFAPVPGEASGFIGGYLFGVWPGFLYSSVGLTLGSWINFAIGRFLGERWVRGFMPAEKWRRIDRLVKRQGVIVIFMLFVFPGFPKDYLCLFLGLTHLPLKIFLILSAVGRMPGTFMLSLQGASLFEREYWIFGILLTACLLAALLAWRYRDPLYRWVEKLNSYTSKH
jgi:uncharacterized membrane protein YdjX (TVP38/TMEM64 family)